MVDPTDHMQKDYEFLVEVEEEILKKLQHGEFDFFSVSFQL